MRENHRVVEAIGLHLARWGVKVEEYLEAGRVATALAVLPSPLLAMQVVEEFRGVPGSVAVVAEIGPEPSRVVFSWSSRRG